MSKLRLRLSYANVMATVAAFLALGGSSYAALRITGQNVKDNSLTGRDVRQGSLTSGDVRNGTLGPSDLKAGALPAGPRGAQGPAGPAGPTGPAGAPGSAATVEGFAVRAPANLPLNGISGVVASKSVPAGRYVLLATAEVQGFGNPTTGYMGGISVVECSIPGYETEDYYLSPNGTYVSEIESLSLHSAIDHRGGPIQLRCDRVWNDAVVREAALTGVRVGSLR